MEALMASLMASLIVLLIASNVFGQKAGDNDKNCMTFLPGQYAHICSCKDLLEANPNAPSGVYFILIHSEGVTEVYCEMGLNGGGYTFLSPASLVKIQDSAVQALFTDKTTFLVRFRKNDGTQPFAVLKQLQQYSHVPLMLGLNHHTGYNKPVNSQPSYSAIGNNYLYIGFLPANLANNKNVQGVLVNNVAVSFSNCDANPNSYMALFPNFGEKAPSQYGSTMGPFGNSYPFCARIPGNARLNPSGRGMPIEYFMMMEMHFGGCGCYGQTDAASNVYLGAAIGFK